MLLYRVHSGLVVIGVNFGMLSVGGAALVSSTVFVYSIYGAMILRYSTTIRARCTT